MIPALYFPFRSLSVQEPDPTAVFESALFYTWVGLAGLAVFVLVWHLSKVRRCTLAALCSL